jgi:hypothetical protein
MINMEEEGKVKWDGFDGAIIGNCYYTGRYIYDTDLMITTLMSRDRMTYQDAWEYLEFNVLNQHLTDDGDENITPIHLVKEYNID